MPFSKTLNTNKSCRKKNKKQKKKPKKHQNQNKGINLISSYKFP